MNGKLVTKILGKIMILEGILMALPLIVSIIYDENIYLKLGKEFIDNVIEEARRDGYIKHDLLVKIVRRAFGNHTVHILKDRNLIDFMWMISLIGYKDIVVPHKVIQIDKKTISSIKQWYIDNKQYITPRNVEKAYNLMYPPPLVFESYETWMEWIDKQCDSLEIRGSKSGFNF